MTRFHQHRRAMTALTVALAAGTFAGCGDDDSKEAAGPVATIEVPGGEPVSVDRNAYDRFYRAGLAGEQSVDVGAVVPLQAPEYATCVAALKKKPEAKGKTPATLKQTCAAQEDRLKQGAIAQAVNPRWILAEAEAQGIDLTDAEVAAKTKELDALLQKNSGGKAAFMKRTGLTAGDLDLNARAGTAQSKLLAKATAGKKGAAVTTAKADFSKGFFERWKARTTCAAGIEAPSVCGKTAATQS